MSQDRKKSRGQSTFGFQNVRPDERQGLVNDVFSQVAEKYDLMNDLMSGGLHRLWKNDLVNWMAPPQHGEFPLLDVAGGTGDIAMRALEAAGQEARAVICDISSEMLHVGMRRAHSTGLASRISFVQGNGETLPFPDRNFACYTIAFGIRNVTHIDMALEEAYRVLKPGGRFLCLEFSTVEVPILDKVYDAFSLNIIPPLGRLASGEAEPYRYLVESIRRFPDQEEFKAMIEKAGFAQVRYRNLSGGIAAIHSGWRI